MRTHAEHYKDEPRGPGTLSICLCFDVTGQLVGHATPANKPPESFIVIATDDEPEDVEKHLHRLRVTPLGAVLVAPTTP
jgi:hypothetical protein